jgi:hypothetical protein
MNVTSPVRRRALGVIAFAAVFLSACAASGSPGDSSPNATSTTVSGPVPAAHFSHIGLVRAGGIAGFRDQVSIERDGSWTATDKAGKQKSGTLPADRLDALVAAAADPKLSTEATRQQKPTVCNDAFSYVLTVDGLSVAYVDCPGDGEQPEAAKKVVSVIAQSGAL